MFFQVEFLRRPHIDTVVRHWEYSSVIGADRVARSLEFAADHDLCYGVFVDGQLVSWLCTTWYTKKKNCAREEYTC